MARSIPLHQPERAEGESQKAYRARQAASKARNRVLTKGPRQTPALSPMMRWTFFWLGQHTSPARNAERRLKREFGHRYLRRQRRASP